MLSAGAASLRSVPTPIAVFRSGAGCQPTRIVEEPILLDSGDGASDDRAVHMYALENRAGGVPVRDYYFAWRSGRLGDAAGGFPTRHLLTFAS